MSADNEKRMKSKTIRIEDRLVQIAIKRIGDTGAKDFSDYVRGLLITDAMTVSPSMSGIDVPGWLIGKRIDFKLIEPDPPANPIGETKKGRRAS